MIDKNEYSDPISGSARVSRVALGVSLDRLGTSSEV